LESFDYAIIGAGPGGYVSAIRAAQLGLKTALIEKDSSLGGCCLNVGCIPSKALLESSELYYMTQNKLDVHGIEVSDVKFKLAKMMKRKGEIVKTLTDGIRLLMKKNKVTVIEGIGKLQDQNTINIEHNGEIREIKAKTIVLAMGSLPVELPFIKFNGKTIISSTEALSLNKIPKHLIVVGAGAIGLELGSVWARLGSKVSIVEMLPHAVPFADKQTAIILQRSLKSQGLEFYFNSKVTKASAKSNKITLHFEDKNDAEQTLDGDKVLVAVGRRPNPHTAGLDKVGIEISGNGFIPVDDNFQTNIPGIYAIGDLIQGPMLAHKAEDEGVAVAEIAAGMPGHVNYENIPNVVYTAPELASVGISEELAKEKKIKYNVGKFYFKGNGRALSLGESDGMVKIIADAETDRLLGVHIVGPRASEMIAEIVIAFEYKASAEDIARTIHAHPTLSEVIKEAALAVDNRQIHG